MNEHTNTDDDEDEKVKVGAARHGMVQVLFSASTTSPSFLPSRKKVTLFLLFLQKENDSSETESEDLLDVKETTESASHPILLTNNQKYKFITSDFLAARYVSLGVHSYIVFNERYHPPT